MNVIESHQRIAPVYESCEQCEASLDVGQRYCIECGARSRNASNPATKFLASRRRGAGSTAVAARPTPQRLTTPVAVLLVGGAAVLVAVGALLAGGRDDSALVAAIKSQKPPVVNVTGGAAGATGAVSATKLPSDFTLDKGFTVKLDTLPVQGTDPAAATKAKQDAKALGAADVGLINPEDFSISPDQGSDSYLIFSGQFETRGEAVKALKKLEKKFSGAEVLAVKSTSGAGAALAKTKHGTVHKASTYKATPKQLKHNEKAIKNIGKAKGKDYLKKQKTLPNEIQVPAAGTDQGAAAPETP